MAISHFTPQHYRVQLFMRKRNLWADKCHLNTCVITIYHNYHTFLLYEKLILARKHLLVLAEILHRNANMLNNKEVKIVLIKHAYFRSTN